MHSRTALKQSSIGVSILEDWRIYRAIGIDVSVGLQSSDEYQSKWAGDHVSHRESCSVISKLRHSARTPDPAGHSPNAP